MTRAYKKVSITENGTTKLVMQRDTSKDDFLKAYSELGTITAAAQRAKITRKTVYQWLMTDLTFANAYTDASKVYGDVIRNAIHNRAIEGVPFPVIYRGQPVLDSNGDPIVERRYSDALLMFMARQLPEYKNQESDLSLQNSYSLLIPDVRQLSQNVLDDLVRDLERIQIESRRHIVESDNA